MVEIDPTLGVLVAAAVLVGITAVAICAKPAQVKSSKAVSSPVSVTASSSEPVVQTKSKKRTRSKPKSKASKAKVEENVEKTVPQSEGENKDENARVRFVETEVAGKEEGKKKKGKNGKSNLPTAVNQSIVVPVSVNSSDSDSSDSEDEVVKPVENTKKPTASELDSIAPPTTQHFSFAQTDGWAVVEDKRKNKKKEESVTTPEPVVIEPVSPVVSTEDSPIAPVIDSVSSEILVDVKKMGLLIGAKGATRTAIQNATGTVIQMPRADKDAVGSLPVTVSGTAAGVNKAITAMNELCIKGYCGLLATDDFQESYVAVHPKYLPDIIGKGGACIKALNAHTGVKITIPPGVSKTPNADGKVSKVKIGLAGAKEKVSLARSLIKDLTKYYHTPVTHPNLTHCEMEIASNYYNFIIGTKGSEIKHIQNSYKVNVHIPDSDSANPNVLIVGTENAVAQAKKHIEKIIDRVNGVAQKSSDEDAAPVVDAFEVNTVEAVKPVHEVVGSRWGVQEESKNVHHVSVDQPGEECWSTEYVPPAAMVVDISPELPQPTGKFASIPITIPALLEPSVSTVVDSKPLTSSAWNNISDKW